MDNAPQLIQERSAPPATLVIFGASGDLTRRKLLPAVESLARHNRLPGEFALVGVARTPMADEQFAASALGGVTISPGATVRTNPSSISVRVRID